ncbi:MAG: hypothetical protein SFZ03_08430 [Candidatus Melainabacteria bacterium]|nr:hypothetical protein [Candidatus Melainabacteria bacterium]
MATYTLVDNEDYWWKKLGWIEVGGWQQIARNNCTKPQWRFALVALAWYCAGLALYRVNLLIYCFTFYSVSLCMLPHSMDVAHWWVNALLSLSLSLNLSSGCSLLMLLFN